VSTQKVETATQRERSGEALLVEIAASAIGRVSDLSRTLGVLLGITPVYIVRSKGADLPSFAYTDGTGIYITPQFIEAIKSKYSGRGSRFVVDLLGTILAHEMLHMLMGHTIYLRDLPQAVETGLSDFREEVRAILRDIAPITFNVVTDAVINDWLEKAGLPNEDGISLRDKNRHPAKFLEAFMASTGIPVKLSERGVENTIRNTHELAATIQILRIIGKQIEQMIQSGQLKATKVKAGTGWGKVTPGKSKVEVEVGGKRVEVPIDIAEPGSTWNELQEKAGRGEVELEPATTGAKKDMEKRAREALERGSQRVTEEDVADAIIEIADFADMIIRSAGTEPGLAERIWKSLRGEDLSSLIRSVQNLIETSVFGLVELPSWSVVSRKMPGLRPGIKRYEFPNIYFLVDTSGSISTDILSRFVGTIAESVAGLGLARAYVIPWDAQPYGVHEVYTRQDVEKLKLRGGGGTVIGSALDLALERFMHGDILVILSDWDIFDINDPETQRKLEELIRRSAISILVTTYEDPPSYATTMPNVYVVHLPHAS